MKTYWWTTTYKNFGDELTPIILEHFLPDVEIELAGRKEEGKVLGVGSIMAALQPGDTIWGSGSNQPGRVYKAKGVRILALRGPLTHKQILGGHSNVVVYGDPGLLLPLIYDPEVEVTHEVGYLPHYVDKKAVIEKAKKEHWSDKVKIIDILGDWQKVIEEVKSCKKIVSSSLHGIICAEAYGIPAVWTKYETSSKIRGGDFKYQDYFLGTGRKEQKPDTVLPPIKDLAKIQKRLIKALENL